MTTAQLRHHFAVAEELEDLSILLGPRKDHEVPLKTGGRILYPGIDMIKESQLLVSSADRLREGTARTTVVGGVSAGKTTLLNALLNHDLPVGPNPKTGVITELVYGQNTDTLSVDYADGSVKTMSIDAFKTFSSLKSGPIRDGIPFPMPDHLIEVRSARIELTADLSEKGLILVDTLGFNAGELAANVTRGYLQDADILMLILGTRPPFSNSDIQFIESQISGINDPKIRNVIVVLNDFSLRDEELADVLEAAQISLDGIVEDFDKQVFVVNAYEALCAKRDGKGPDVLAATGLTALEHALEQHIENASQIVMESTFERRVIPCIEASRNHITIQTAALNSDLADLEDAVAASQEDLKAAQQKAENLVGKFDQFTKTLSEKIASSFHNYFTVRIGKEVWREDWERLAPPVKFFELAGSIMPTRKGEARREKLEAKFKEPVQKLIGGKIEEWGSQLPEELAPVLETYSHTFEQAANDFAESLTATDEKFVQRIGINTADLDVARTRENWNRVIQMILGTLLLDPNQVLGTVYAPNWGAFMRRLVVEIIAGIAAFFLFGPYGLIALIVTLIVEFLVNFLSDRESAQSKLADKVADELRRKFATESIAIQQQIKLKVADRLAKHAKDLQVMTNEEIYSRNTRLTSLLDEKTGGSYVKETERLERLEAAINERRNAISHRIYGKVLTDEDIRDMFDSNTGVF